jgi:hypothetical protein
VISFWKLNQLPEEADGTNGLRKVLESDWLDNIGIDPQVIPTESIFFGLGCGENDDG